MARYMYMYSMHAARNEDRSSAAAPHSQQLDHPAAPLKEQLPSAGPRNGSYAQLCHGEGITRGPRTLIEHSRVQCSMRTSIALAAGVHWKMHVRQNIAVC